MTTTDSPWVGTAEAATYLGCHPDNLIRWLADGRALPVSPPWRIGPSRPVAVEPRRTGALRTGCPMTPDASTFIALAALVLVGILLYFTLRQALGERGRAGVGRIADSIASVLSAFSTKPKQKEVSVDPQRETLPIGRIIAGAIPFTGVLGDFRPHPDPARLVTDFARRAYESRVSASWSRWVGLAFTVLILGLTATTNPWLAPLTVICWLLLVNRLVWREGADPSPRAASGAQPPRVVGALALASRGLHVAGRHGVPGTVVVGKRRPSSRSPPYCWHSATRR